MAPLTRLGMMPKQHRALELAEKLISTVILSIDRLLAAHDGQKLRPRKCSADLFCRSAAFPYPQGTNRGPTRLAFDVLPPGF
jgi:hypothetical protein